MSAAQTISPDWIAVDWGTSNLRAYAMTSAGELLAQTGSDQGMSSLAPAEFEPALRALLAGWSLPKPCIVIGCGMVGSRQGWCEAPYRAVPCPAGTRQLVAAPVGSNDLQMWIVPGVKQASPPDVMRGEETQIAGFLALNPDWDGILCLPGTHSKWVHISAGEIVSFRTFMTGELFDTLRSHTVLRHSLGGDGLDQAAFGEAVSATLSRPESFSASLFALRAADLLDGQSASTARAKLSGALIGMELAAARPYWLGQRVALIGAGALCDLYAQALSAQGVQPERSEAEAVTRAGLFDLFQTL